jgi:hypothetical protein
MLVCVNIVLNLYNIISVPVIMLSRVLPTLRVILSILDCKYIYIIMLISKVVMLPSRIDNNTHIYINSMRLVLYYSMVILVLF